MRSPNLVSCCQKKLTHAALAFVGLALVATGCGGGAADGGGTGSLTLRALWEQSSQALQFGRRDFQGSDQIPPSVKTVEVRITIPAQSPRRVFSDPATRQVTVSNLPAGVVDVQVLGYDVPFSEQQAIVDFNLPPSFRSDPRSVQIAPRQNTDAGEFALLAQPFATEFDPPPGSRAVPPEFPIFFAIVTAVGSIEPASISVVVAGEAVVSAGVPQPGASLIPCDDFVEVPCTFDFQGLRGFLFNYQPLAQFPEDSAIDVSVGAEDDRERAFSFSYEFTTGTALFTPIPTPTHTPTSTPLPPVTTTTPTSTATRTPTLRATDTLTPTRSATAVATPTASATMPSTATLTSTPTTASSPTPSSSSTPTVSETETPPASPTATVTETEGPVTATPTVTAPPTVTETSSATPTATPTVDASPTATETITEASSPTPTPEPPATPSATPEATPSETPTETASETPTESPTPVPTEALTAEGKARVRKEMVA